MALRVLVLMCLAAAVTANIVNFKDMLMLQRKNLNASAVDILDEREGDGKKKSCGDLQVGFYTLSGYVYYGEGEYYPVQGQIQVLPEKKPVNYVENPCQLAVYLNSPAFSSYKPLEKDVGLFLYPFASGDPCFDSVFGYVDEYSLFIMFVSDLITPHTRSVTFILEEGESGEYYGNAVLTKTQGGGGYTELFKQYFGGCA